MSQTIRLRLLSVWFLGLVWMASCTGQPVPPPSPVPLATLADHPGVHVLLALDTDDKKVGPSIKTDGENVEALLRSGLPAGKLAITVIKGRNLNAAAILATLKRMEADPSDAVLFYFSGHGFLEDDRGHALHMPTKPALARSTLRSAVKAKGARLSVILTDCCAKALEKPPVTETFPVDFGPVLRELLLKPRGEVDINACSKGEYAEGYDSTGGVFTESLIRELGRASKRNERLSWERLFPMVVRETKRKNKEQTPQKMTDAAWPVVE